MCVKHQKGIIITVYVVVVASFIAFITSYFLTVDHINKYISGKYGSVCYREGEENPNIKYPIEFDNLEDCQKYINNQ